MPSGIPFVLASKVLLKSIRRTNDQILGITSALVKAEGAFELSSKVTNSQLSGSDNSFLRSLLFKIMTGLEGLVMSNERMA